MAFERRLRLVRTYLSCREEMREYSTQVYQIVRTYVLEAGRRLVKAGKLSAADDAFHFLEEELIGLTVGPAGGGIDTTEGARILAFRKRMYEGYRDFVPPNELGGTICQRQEEEYVTQKDGKKVLTGLGCSTGVVTGPVRVIHSLDEMHLIRRGEILVTRFTDPGWTPILGLVAGVVTEVGGLLSHAAVIGREYGIPAVLNIPGATRVFQTGMRVSMNGLTGEVVLMDEDPAP